MTIYKKAKYLDVQYLKTKILPIVNTKKIFNSIQRPISKQPINLALRSWKQLIAKDLIYIAKLYNARLIIKSQTNTASNYSRGPRLITLILDNKKTHILPSICKVFSHELAHCIQHSILQEEFESDQPVRKELGYKLSRLVEHERVAERLGYFIYKAYFDHIGPLHHSTFSCYKSQKDILFLYGYHSILNSCHVINDLDIKVLI